MGFGDLLSNGPYDDAASTLMPRGFRLRHIVTLAGVAALAHYFVVGSYERFRLRLQVLKLAYRLVLLSLRRSVGAVRLDPLASPAWEHVDAFKTLERPFNATERCLVQEDQSLGVPKAVAQGSPVDEQGPRAICEGRAGQVRHGCTPWGCRRWRAAKGRLKTVSYFQGQEPPAGVLREINGPFDGDLHFRDEAEVGWPWAPCGVDTALTSTSNCALTRARRAAAPTAG